MLGHERDVFNIKDAAIWKCCREHAEEQATRGNPRSGTRSQVVGHEQDTLGSVGAAVLESRYEAKR